LDLLELGLHVLDGAAFDDLGEEGGVRPEKGEGFKGLLLLLGHLVSECFTANGAVSQRIASIRSHCFCILQTL